MLWLATTKLSEPKTAPARHRKCELHLLFALEGSL